MSEKLRHLVVVVPGILGSALEDTEGRVVWGISPDLLRTGFDPERLDTGEHPRLRPTGLLPNIRLLPPVLTPGYGRLVTLIDTFFPGARFDTAVPGRQRDLSADVVLFPYDFRLGVVDAAERLKAEIDARLAHLSADQRAGRVVVLAHSMGGLVARYWAGPLGGHADCASLVTLGTPHRGAPKALKSLVDGIPWGGARWTSVLRGWRSAYELLPRYRMVLPEGAEALAENALYPHELQCFPGFGEPAKEAYRLHQEIEDVWHGLVARGTRPEVVPLFSRGHATYSHAVLSGNRLRASKEDPAWLPNPGWGGDGTVPAISAIQTELAPRAAPGALSHRHLKISGAREAVERLRNLSSEDLVGLQGGGPAAWLGLDLEPVVAAHQPFRVGVRLCQARPGEETRVLARVRSAAEHPPAGSWGPVHEGEPNGHGWWWIRIPGVPGGTHQIRVDALRIPDTGELFQEETFGAVDPEWTGASI